jgi:hypothetical protein
MYERATVQFVEAVRKMAVSPKSIQERLLEGMLHVVGYMDNAIPDQLPENLVPGIQRWWAQATNIDPKQLDISGPHEDRLTTTIMKMTVEEAVTLAKDLVYFEDELLSYYQGLRVD